MEALEDKVARLDRRFARLQGEFSQLSREVADFYDDDPEGAPSA